MLPNRLNFDKSGNTGIYLILDYTNQVLWTDFFSAVIWRGLVAQKQRPSLLIILGHELVEIPSLHTT